MNEQGTFIARLLDVSGRAHASAAILRMQAATTSGERLVQEWGFQALVGELEARIQCLSEALASGCQELFVQDVRWISALHEARDVPASVLHELLTHLEAELLENLPEEHAALVAQTIRAASPEAAPIPSTPRVVENHHVDLLNRFIVAVLEARADRAEQLIVDAIDQGLSAPDLHSFVLTPAQREFGDMWQRGEITVAEEHLGSRIVERALDHARIRMSRLPSTGRKVLLASVAGNLHDIGLRVISDHFEMNGWRPIFLGANMPIADLARAVSEHDPNLVALSVGLGTHVRSTADTIQALRAERAGLPILVGGGPFSRIEGLWKVVGADACATTAASAVELGTLLTNP